VPPEREKRRKRNRATHPHLCLSCGQEFLGYKEAKYCTSACYAVAAKQNAKRRTAEQDKLRNEKRAAYSREWRENNREYHPTYNRQWKKDNPEKYQERQRRYKENNRTEINLRRRETMAERRAAMEIKPPASGHEVFDQARALVNRTIGRSATFGTFEPGEDYYDMVSEALLAQLEGRDPVEAVQRFRKDATRLQFATQGISDAVEQTMRDESWDNWEERAA
jgi:hypothetical protein